MGKRYLVGERGARFIRDQLNATGAGSTRRGRVFIEELGGVPAFTVRWSDDYDAWIIRLPEPSFIFDGLAIDLAADLEEVEDYAKGWYCLDGMVDPDGASEIPIYLAVYADGTVGFTSDLSDSDFAWNIQIAAVWRHPSGSAHQIPEVRQLVKGVIFATLPGPFQMVRTDAGLTFANRLYRVGGRTYTTGSTALPVGTDTTGYIALVVTMTGSAPTAVTRLFSTLAALQSAEANADNYVIPLYLLANGVPVCDLRKIPAAAAFEFAS